MTNGAQNALPKTHRISLWKIIWRIIWSIVIALHIVGMIGWWWPNRPHGFPLTHPRFWVHEALPWLFSATSVLAIASAWRRRDTFFRVIIWAMPAGYATVAISTLLIYPISSRSNLRELFGLPWLLPCGFWLHMLGLAVVLLIMALLTNGRRRYPSLALTAVVAMGIGVGFLFTWSQRAEDPSTRPAARALPTLPETAETIRADQAVFSSELTVDAEKGQISLKRGNLQIRIDPLLTFHTRSPDRWWTMLAPLKWNGRLSRPLASTHKDEDGFYLAYAGEEPARILIKEKKNGSVEIEAWAQLPAPVFSHGNFFCRVRVKNYRKLSISFSPCPQERIEMQPHSYPHYWIDQGFAYLDAFDRFFLAKGSWEEKGPFHHLASGSLKRGDPLTVTLFDEGQPVCRIVMEDWSSQVSTAVSPTAGWGLPVNAITASVGPKSYGAEVEINFQLAGTHVGAGSDSVGHTAGIYRSRIRFEPIAGKVSLISTETAEKQQTNGQ